MLTKMLMMIMMMCGWLQLTLCFAGEIVIYATYQSSPQSLGRVLKDSGALEGLKQQLTGQN